MRTNTALKSCKPPLDSVDVRVMIVSSVRLLRDGLAAMLAQRRGVHRIHAVASADAALLALADFAPTLMLCSPRLVAIMFRQLAVLAGPVRHDADAAQLTGREREIVQFIDEGLSNKEIARLLSIEVSTVKNHVHNILDKLQVTRRGEAAARLRIADPRHGSGIEGSMRT